MEFKTNTNVITHDDSIMKMDKDITLDDEIDCNSSTDDSWLIEIDES